MTNTITPVSYQNLMKNNLNDQMSRTYGTMNEALPSTLIKVKKRIDMKKLKKTYIDDVRTFYEKSGISVSKQANLRKFIEHTFHSNAKPKKPSPNRETSKGISPVNNQTIRSGVQYFPPKTKTLSMRKYSLQDRPQSPQPLSVSSKPLRLAEFQPLQLSTTDLPLQIMTQMLRASEAQSSQQGKHLNTETSFIETPLPPKAQKSLRMNKASQEELKQLGSERNGFIKPFTPISSENNIYQRESIAKQKDDRDHYQIQKARVQNTRKRSSREFDAQIELKAQLSSRDDERSDQQQVRLFKSDSVKSKVSSKREQAEPHYIINEPELINLSRESLKHSLLKSGTDLALYEYSQSSQNRDLKSSKPLFLLKSNEQSLQNILISDRSECEVRPYSVRKDQILEGMIIKKKKKLTEQLKAKILNQNDSPRLNTEDQGLSSDILGKFLIQRPESENSHRLDNDHILIKAGTEVKIVPSSNLCNEVEEIIQERVPHNNKNSQSDQNVNEQQEQYILVTFHTDKQFLDREQVSVISNKNQPDQTSDVHIHTSPLKLETLNQNDDQLNLLEMFTIQLQMQQTLQFQRAAIQYKQSSLIQSEESSINKKYVNIFKRQVCELNQTQELQEMLLIPLIRMSKSNNYLPDDLHRRLYLTKTQKYKKHSSNFVPQSTLANLFKQEVLLSQSLIRSKILFIDSKRFRISKLLKKTKLTQSQRVQVYSSQELDLYVDGQAVDMSLNFDMNSLAKKRKKTPLNQRASEQDFTFKSLDAKSGFKQISRIGSSTSNNSHPKILELNPAKSIQDFDLSEIDVSDYKILSEKVQKQFEIQFLKKNILSMQILPQYIYPNESKGQQKSFHRQVTNKLMPNLKDPLFRNRGNSSVRQIPEEESDEDEGAEYIKSNTKRFKFFLLSNNEIFNDQSKMQLAGILNNLSKAVKDHTYFKGSDIILEEISRILNYHKKVIMNEQFRMQHQILSKQSTPDSLVLSFEQPQSSKIN